MKRLFVIVLALCSMLHAAEQSAPAPSVTLSGTVKDSANPLEGVTVTLAKIKTLSTQSKANGTFTLTNVTGVLLPKSLTTPYGFSFKNNTIVLTGGFEKVSGTMSLNSIDGRLIASVSLDNLNAGQQCLALPELSPGMYLLSGTVEGESFTRSLVSMGNRVYLRNDAANASGNGSFFLGKSAAAAVADTIIAFKEGYDTNKTAITSYTKDGIAIAMKKKGAGGFAITSTKFKEGDKMPDAYTCQGKSLTGMTSPPLAWSGTPAETKSYAMTFLDMTIVTSSKPDLGYHWAMWNIPASITQLAESFDGTLYKQFSAVASMAGSNKFFGPCPGAGKKDTYAFTLYAFKEETINPGSSLDVKKLVTFFNKNAIDSTKIAVWSDAKSN